ncbi:hypothetical protein H6F51_07430 [Cyanobacteria bacterium FACHB-DQ100]|nr:hypothetical protein [Cyanobacteria bacterium FACHB-DQ100]
MSIGKARSRKVRVIVVGGLGVLTEAISQRSTSIDLNESIDNTASTHSHTNSSPASGNRTPLIQYWRMKGVFCPTMSYFSDPMHCFSPRDRCFSDPMHYSSPRDRRFSSRDRCFSSPMSYFSSLMSYSSSPMSCFSSRDHCFSSPMSCFC